MHKRIRLETPENEGDAPCGEQSPKRCKDSWHRVSTCQPSTRPSLPLPMRSSLWLRPKCFPAVPRSAGYRRSRTGQTREAAPNAACCCVRRWLTAFHSPRATGRLPLAAYCWPPATENLPTDRLLPGPLSAGCLRLTAHSPWAPPKSAWVAADTWAPSTSMGTRHPLGHRRAQGLRRGRLQLAAYQRPSAYYLLPTPNSLRTTGKLHATGRQLTVVYC